ncbi:ORF21 [Apiospora arundinis]
MVVIKRKRSESELSCTSSSACSYNNSPQRPGTGAFQFDMHMKSSLHFSHHATSGNLHSRTMKRFRDSRPSQNEVHQRTLNMLYNAQKNQPHDGDQMQTEPMQIQPAVAQHPEHHQQQAQPSLHSFWKLPNPNGTSTSFNTLPTSIATPSIDVPTDCEDCGQALHDVMDGDAMKVDDAADSGCGSCGKHVCSHCSITNMGEQRRCLGCAGKKTWVGGIGWTPNLSAAGGITQFFS